MWFRVFSWVKFLWGIPQKSTELFASQLLVFQKAEDFSYSKHLAFFSLQVKILHQLPLTLIYIHTLLKAILVTLSIYVTVQASKEWTIYAWLYFENPRQISFIIALNVPNSHMDLSHLSPQLLLSNSESRHLLQKLYIKIIIYISIKSCIQKFQDALQIF